MRMRPERVAGSTAHRHGCVAERRVGSASRCGAMRRGTMSTLIKCVPMPLRHPQEQYRPPPLGIGVVTVYPASSFLQLVKVYLTFPRLLK
jgi:hypothetical protein